VEGTSGAVELDSFREEAGEAALQGEPRFGAVSWAGWFGFPRPNRTVAGPDIFLVRSSISRRQEVPESNRLG
jgi:hypothetical protein